MGQLSMTYVSLGQQFVASGNCVKPAFYSRDHHTLSECQCGFGHHARRADLIRYICSKVIKPAGFDHWKEVG